MREGAGPTELEIRHDEAGGRYVALLDGEPVGLADYTRSGDTIVFTHTEVDDEVEGRGIGTALVTRALADARRLGLVVVPACPFVGAYVAHHPSERDLLTRRPPAEGC